MQIDEGTYKRLPAHLQALFERLPNPSSDEVLALFPKTQQPSFRNGDRVSNNDGIVPWNRGRDTGREVKGAGYADVGSAARFFYCAKASKRDRDEGLDGMPLQRRETRTETGAGAWEQKGPQPSRNPHPTVKPTDLMRYLCRLVTPPGGIVLDPFAGSGSTGKACALEGFRFIGIERDAEYCEIAEARIAAVEVGLFGAAL